MAKPELTVIAGPNGAGKSTLSNMLVLAGTDIFDGDKELLQLQKRFPGIDSDTLFDNVQDVLFPDRKKAAIDKQEDFAFETNFGYPTVMNSVNQFKEAGYHVHLIYIGLRSVEYSLERVSLRHSRGGHDVPGDLVNFNYKNGLINVARYIRQFDTAALMYNSVTENESLRMVSLAEFKEGMLLNQSKKMPDWAKLILKGSKEKPSIRQPVKIVVPNRKGRKR